MVYAFAKLLGLFAALGSLLILALVAGVLLLWRRRRWKRGRSVVTAATLALLLAVLTPLQPFLTARLEDRFPAPAALPDRVDGIIVLGGMIRPNISKARHRPTMNDAAERLLEGARLAALRPDARLLFSGGSADPWHPAAREADFVADALRLMGVGPDRLLLEDKSRNTYENAVFSRQVAQPRPGEVWVLVTSAMHMPRAVGAFRQAGWTVLPWPTNYLTGGAADWVNEDLPIQRLSRLSRTLHEWGGLLYYRLRGWSGSLFPAPG